MRLVTYMWYGSRLDQTLQLHESKDLNRKLSEKIAQFEAKMAKMEERHEERRFYERLRPFSGSAGVSAHL